MQKVPLLQMIQSRPRLILAIFLGVAVSYLLPASLALLPLTRTLIGWNVMVLSYLALTSQLIFSKNQDIKERALRNDEGQYVVLAMAIVAAFASIGAIVAETIVAKSVTGSERVSHIGLAACTIVLTWAFIQTMFALQYAHYYYLPSRDGKLRGGLDFPSTPLPNYGDFLYFACIIGTSSQTADVNISSQTMRRTVLVHCVLAFFFNTAILALTINIVSGLI